MNKHTRWINRNIRLGWILLAAGLMVSLLGIILPWLAEDLPFNEKIVTGLGIFLAGLGLGNLVRYGALRRDPRAARKAAAEEHDERTRAQQARAGSRAYSFSAGLAFAALMWASFADNGSLPPLAGDSLWFTLATVVIIPFVVYITSLLLDQQRC